jgi:hypothetical protein
MMHARADGARGSRADAMRSRSDARLHFILHSRATVRIEFKSQ